MSSSMVSLVIFYLAVMKIEWDESQDEQIFCNVIL